MQAVSKPTSCRAKPRWNTRRSFSNFGRAAKPVAKEQTLREMEEGYDGMLVILQNFLANQKYSEAHAYRISLCATKIAETLGLDSGSTEDIRTAALLFNLKELGITTEVLCKAAQVSETDLLKRGQKRKRITASSGTLGSALLRAIPIFLAERQLRQNGGNPEDASFEVQILTLAEEYEGLVSGQNGSKMSPTQAGQEVIRKSSGRCDSLVLEAFSKAFGGHAAGAGA